jgi:spore maturation protein CgeB
MTRTCDFGRSCAEALRRLGYDVCQWDHRALALQEGDEEANRLLAKQLRKKYDLFFLIKGDSIDPNVVKFAHRMGATTAIWNVDDPHENNLAARLSPLFDYVFTPMLQQAHPIYRGLSKRPILLPLTCSEDYVPMTLEEGLEDDIDVSFIGTRYPGRKEMLDAVKKRFPNKVISHFGSDWPDTVRLSDEAAVKVINMSKVNLVVSQRENLEFGVINPRVFEILACKGFALVDSHIGISTFFRHHHLHVYYDLDTLLHEIDRALLDPRMRQRVAWGGYREYLRWHRPEKRMQTMLKLMGL